MKDKELPFRIFNWAKWKSRYFKTYEEMIKTAIDTSKERYEKLEIKEIGNGITSIGYSPMSLPILNEV